MSSLAFKSPATRAFGAKLDDIGNAERFIEHHGHRVRYVPHWRTWLAWDGTRWKIDHDGAEVLSLARATARSIFVEASEASDNQAAKRLAGWAYESARLSRLRAMTTIGRSDVCVAPDQLDAKPHLLNVANGTVCLRTGELRAHDPADLFTKVSPTPYVPEAEGSTPTFDRFMREIFVERVELIGYVIRLLGYAMSGDTTEHILPVFFGAGRNGKTVLLQAVMDVVGSDYVANVHESVLTLRGDPHPTNVADLQGLRIGIAPETDKAARLHCEAMKRLTGERRIKARRMRADFYEFERTFTLVMVTNHLPMVDDESEATWRRLRVVPFDFIVPEDKVDLRLGEKLKAEANGILARLIQGCRDALADGLAEPEEVRARTEQYRHDEDRIGRFIDDRLEFVRGVSVKAGDLRTALSAWCATEGEEINYQRELLPAMEARGAVRGQNRALGRHLRNVQMGATA